MDRFKGCKGISSDQYFGREQVRLESECDHQYDEQESHEKLKQFAGARSISSAQYYGNGEQKPAVKSEGSVMSSIASGAYSLGVNAAQALKGYLSKQSDVCYKQITVYILLYLPFCQ